MRTYLISHYLSFFVHLNKLIVSIFRLLMYCHSNWQRWMYLLLSTIVKTKQINTLVVTYFLYWQLFQFCAPTEKHDLESTNINLPTLLRCYSFFFLHKELISFKFKLTMEGASYSLIQLNISRSIFKFRGQASNVAKQCKIKTKHKKIDSTELNWSPSQAELYTTRKI